MARSPIDGDARVSPLTTTRVPPALATAGIHGIRSTIGHLNAALHALTALVRRAKGGLGGGGGGWIRFGQVEWGALALAAQRHRDVLQAHPRGQLLDIVRPSAYVEHLQAEVAVAEAASAWARARARVRARARARRRRRARGRGRGHVLAPCRELSWGGPA